MIKKIMYVNKNGEISGEKNLHFTDSMNDDGYRIPSHKMGSRMFSDVQFPKEMTDSDVGKMARLSKLMVGGTNLLGYRKNRRIEGYTNLEIGKLIGLDKDRPARNFINKMIRLHVIKKNEIGYYINPAYFMANGQRLSLDLFLLFQDDLGLILPDWAILDFLRQAKEKQ